jgi:hypothetical protein
MVDLVPLFSPSDLLLLLSLPTIRLLFSVCVLKNDQSLIVVQRQRYRSNNNNIPQRWARARAPGPHATPPNSRCQTFHQRRITHFLLDKNNVECNRLRNEEIPNSKGWSFNINVSRRQSKARSASQAIVKTHNSSAILPLSGGVELCGIAATRAQPAGVT